MENEIVFCPKCRYYVGAWDKEDYLQCCRNKKHKIKKEDKNDKERSKNKDNN